MSVPEDKREAFDGKSWKRLDDFGYAMCLDRLLNSDTGAVKVVKIWKVQPKYSRTINYRILN